MLLLACTGECCLLLFYSKYRDCYISTILYFAKNSYSKTIKTDFTIFLKHSFFQAVVVLILLYGCTTWTLTKRLEIKLDGNYTRMLRAILNKSWWQHPTRHQLYSHLPLIMKTIQVRRTRHAGHCWRSRGELISDVLLRTPTYGRAKARRPPRTYIQQLCEDTGCSPEDLPEAMNDREKWQERVRDIRVCGTTWWWWWWYWLYLDFVLISSKITLLYWHLHLNFKILVFILLMIESNTGSLSSRREGKLGFLPKTSWLGL